MVVVCLLVFWLCFGGSSAIISCGGDSPLRWSIHNNGISIGAGHRVSGAIDSVMFRGMEYINACDHGRELQLAVTTTFGECYNPTEAGSVADSGGISSSSKLLAMNTDENIMKSVTSPAFWLPPGTCESSCGCARNKAVTSLYNMSKSVQIGPHNSFSYIATIQIPEATSFLQIESPTGYMNGIFTKFWSIDPKTGHTTPIPSPGSGKPAISHLPVCVGTPDEEHVMCALSKLETKYYAVFDFSHLSPVEEATTKWTIVRQWNNVPAHSVMEVHSYVCIGRLDEVKTCMKEMYTMSHQ
eukprot:TRINITY_DN22499_c0_g1_i1.p1 TRINITY_DN22499_c0_g1~~TRINITY_DN22499_c0_g1_i1.p1  ORF type:complete len:298 (+),score=59.45 TRINITY_DN22499_c0_g1_i1:29-922(+)